jgi:hypothetical protein
MMRLVRPGILFCAVGLVAALAAGRVAAAYQDATPAASPPAVAATGGLADLLALAPDVLADPAPPELLIATFADSAAQMASVGAKPPASIDDEAFDFWVDSNWWMPVPSPIRENVLNEEWRPLFGFDRTQIDRSLEVGEPPARLFILQGRFDETELTTAWQASGYQPLDVPGAVVYSLAEDERIDFENPVQRLALGAMNNAAILPDGTLLFASRLDRLEQGIATARGEAPSLLDRPEIAELVAAGDPGLVAAFLTTGEALQAEPIGDVNDSATVAAAFATAAAAEAAVVGAMPPVDLALLGVTAGGPLPFERTEGGATPVGFLPDAPDARLVISLRFADRAAVETAASVVDHRLASGQSASDQRPWTEFFADWTLAVAPDAPVLTVTLTYGPETRVDIWMGLLFRRDLGFVAW